MSSTDYFLSIIVIPKGHRKKNHFNIHPNAKTSGACQLIAISLRA
jgi:hypothetical protein